MKIRKIEVTQSVLNPDTYEQCRGIKISTSTPLEENRSIKTDDQLAFEIGNKVLKALRDLPSGGAIYYEEPEAKRVFM